MMTGPPPTMARRRAVFPASSLASSTTMTPPSARSRAASRAIERWGSASMMVQRRPWRCQWTARQLATVLLPLPPFMVATVMIELVTDRLLAQVPKRRIHQNQYYRFPGELPTSGNPQPRDGRSL
jgi:hypothetical protein